jgi:arylsulfatase A-like enzyme
MKLSLLVFASIFLTGFYTGCHPGRKSSSDLNENVDKPNILFIFADDQSYSTVHALGNHEIITSNLDKLVNAGTTFTHTYNMGAWHGAVCVASRAMLNTGRFVWRAYGYENHQQDLVDRGEMWGQLMQKAGYETYMTGKWHVKTSADTLFNHVVHVRPGMPGTVPEAYNRPLSAGDSSCTPWNKDFGGYWKGGKHWSEVLGDDAIAFLDSAKNSENPFFMYLAFNAPHDPRQSPKEYVDMYPLENISVPESFAPEYPFKDSIGCVPSLRDEALAPFPRTEYAVKVHRQEYYAIISHMDAQIGRILDALEKSGKADNTYIFFTADHGLAIGNHGLMGKQNMYDHSIRVPLFVIGPDVPKNKKIDVDVYLQYIMASALNLFQHLFNRGVFEFKPCLQSFVRQNSGAFGEHRSRLSIQQFQGKGWYRNKRRTVYFFGQGAGKAGIGDFLRCGQVENSCCIFIFCCPCKGASHIGFVHKRKGLFTVSNFSANTQFKQR